MRQEYHVISHQNFERVRFDIKEKYDMVIMEGHCRNCNQYWYRGGNIVEYLKAIALHPTNPIMARCPTCNIDDSSTIHRDFTTSDVDWDLFLLLQLLYLYHKFHYLVR